MYIEATETPTKPLSEVATADLLSAYNGARGCACGCRGTHSYMDAAEGTTSTGYEVTPAEVSPRRVTNTLRTIQAHADEARYFFGSWSYQSQTRLYIAYLRW